MLSRLLRDVTHMYQLKKKTIYLDCRVFKIEMFLLLKEVYKEIKKFSDKIQKFHKIEVTKIIKQSFLAKT